MIGCQFNFVPDIIYGLHTIFANLSDYIILLYLHLCIPIIIV